MDLVVGVTLFIMLYLPLCLAKNGYDPIDCYSCNTEEVTSDCTKVLWNHTKTCSSEARGCSIYYEDNAVIHMGCENYNFNKCLVANDVTYCYCKGNLCNEIDLIKHTLSDTDDEDLNEGSGLEITEVIQTTVPSIVKPFSAGYRIQNELRIFIYVFFMLVRESCRLV